MDGKKVSKQELKMVERLLRQLEKAEESASILNLHLICNGRGDVFLERVHLIRSRIASAMLEAEQMIYEGGKGTDEQTSCGNCGTVVE